MNNTKRKGSYCFHNVCFHSSDDNGSRYLTIDITPSQSELLEFFAVGVGQNFRLCGKTAQKLVGDDLESHSSRWLEADSWVTGVPEDINLSITKPKGEWISRFKTEIFSRLFLSSPNTHACCVTTFQACFREQNIANLVMYVISYQALQAFWLTLFHD